MKKYWLLFVVTLLFIRSLWAVEGMWLPILLKEINEKEMKAMGMRISAEDLYSINRSSLKDAVFLFGGGCTSEIISSQGLLLTNHHCGYGQIQSHSSLKNDYLKYGFWAKSLKDELPNKGLTATRIVRMENVTDDVLKGAIKSDGTLEQSIVDANSKRIAQQSVQGTHYEASVKPFYYGNEYYLFITETFKDIRLVGTPPSFIGKFGGDTDNWMWPRHTGDFAVFRIYAGVDNKPAEYSENNVPYKPLHHFPISLKGVQPNDFTLVYGFPGRTQQYLPSAMVKLTMNDLNPIRIQIRQKALSVIDKAMASSDELRIKYAAKQSRISNAYKKWIGENRGLKKLDAIRIKQEWESRYLQAVKGTPYESLVQQFNNLVENFRPYALANDYYNEFIFSGPEIIRYTNNYVKFIKSYQELKSKGELDKQIQALKSSAEGYFKNYDKEVDRQIMLAVLPVFTSGLDVEMFPQVLKDELSKYKNDIPAMTNSLYATTLFADKNKILGWLENVNEKSIKKMMADPMYKITDNLYQTYQDKIDKVYKEYFDKIQTAMFAFLKSLRKYLPNDRRYYPDANSTLRVSYGKVEGYSPKDGIVYHWQTTVDGIIQKYIPNDTEFDLDQRFIDLYKNKDYGRYGSNGTLPVAFTASNHTTGGNSGSPVLNANGHLIGINFDRAWESTMSDIMYDPERCRNIICDIRYVLWVIDKYADATHLVNEMTIIE
ncbi:MAG: S46 family peptidase [Flavobacteriales bacterium]|nr:S46 family peptidase [Flavobacteriales bacterium]